MMLPNQRAAPVPCPECDRPLAVSVQLRVDEDDSALVGSWEHAGAVVYVIDTDELTRAAWDLADVELVCGECGWGRFLDHGEWEHGRRPVDA